jgi:hypothetical protein
MLAESNARILAHREHLEFRVSNRGSVNPPALAGVKRPPLPLGEEGWGEGGARQWNASTLTLTFYRSWERGQSGERPIDRLPAVI